MPTPPTQTRAQARDEQDEQDRIQRERDLRGALLDAVDLANQQGLPLSVRALCDRVQGAKTDAKRRAVARASAELSDRARKYESARWFAKKAATRPNTWCSPVMGVAA